MATSVVFGLLDRLVELFTETLTDITVYDGFGVSDDPGDFLMVGVEDPDMVGAETSADAQQKWAGLGAKSRDEEGTVTCAALSWNGDGDQSAARLRVAEITQALEDVLRADPNLGGVVPGLMWTGYGTRTRLIQDQTETGAMALCVFEIAFRARI